MITRIEHLSNAEYPREIHDRIQQLKALQEDHDKLEKEMLENIQSIEAKYQELDDDESQVESKRLEINATEAKYHQSVEPLFAKIMLQDTKALWYLTDVRYAKGDPDQGLKLEFFFKPNPFFKNQVLTKVVGGNGIGAAIDWYPGKCWTQMDVEKRKKICDKCDIKNLSFFNFFRSNPADDEVLDSYIGDLLVKRIIPRAVDVFLDRGHYLATLEELKG